MHIATYIPAEAHRRQPKSSLALIFLSTGVLLIGMLLTPTLALAGGVPGGNIANPVVRAVDVAKPAVVRIITTLGGHLTVQFSATRSATFPLNGGSYPLPLSGTGTFISSHGDILTADHVVAPPHDQTLDTYLETLAAQDVADYINQTTGQVPPYTNTDVLGALQAGLFHAITQYDQPSSVVYFSTDYSGPLNATNLNALPAGLQAPVDKIEQQSTPDQKDVAIIHVNLTNTPSVQLGDSTGVEPQDELTIIGFPGNGDISDKQIPMTVLTSSVNKVYVSALKNTDAGAPVIQVGGNVEQGDSGGPALDSNGNVVGIVSFGKADVNGGPMGTSFLQAGSSAQALINSLNLDLKPGPLQKAWSQAFSDYASNAPDHWQRAQSEFQQIQKSYPQFQAIAPYLAYATTQARQQPANQPTQSPGAPGSLALIIVGGIIVVLAIAIGLTLFFVLQNKRRPSYPPMNVSTPPSLPNFPPQQPGAVSNQAQTTSPFFAAMTQEQSPFALATQRREPAPAALERRESTPIAAMSPQPSQPFAAFPPQAVSTPMSAVRQPGQAGRPFAAFSPQSVSSPMPAVPPAPQSPRPAPTAWGTNGAYNYRPFPEEPTWQAGRPSPTGEETTPAFTGFPPSPPPRPRLVPPDNTEIRRP